MRILARPAFANRNTDPGNAALYSEIKRSGATVVEGTNTALVHKSADIVHIHWPDNVLRSPRLVLAALRTALLFVVLSLQRSRGAKVIWTAHNITSHEHHHHKLERIFWRGLFRRLDGIIVHSETVRRDLSTQTQGLIPITVIPLSCFCGLYPEAPAVTITENKPCSFGFIGRIRQYKGVPELINAFVPFSHSSVKLIVRGQPEDPQTADTIKALCSKDPRIDLQFGFLSPEQLSTEIARLNAVILPFRQVTNSGSALLSLSLGTKVVVPDTPYFQELQAEFGASWVYCYSGSLTPTTLTHVLTWAQMRPSAQRPIFSEKRTPSWAAQATLNFYQTVLGEKLQNPQGH